MDPDEADTIIDRIRATGRLKLARKREIDFAEPTDLKFLQRERLPHHSNGMRFSAFDAAGSLVESSVYYSVGGGAVVDEAAIARNAPPEGAWDIPFNYHSADELLAIAEREELSIADIARANERAGFSDEEMNRRLDAIASAMSACIDRGIGQDGILPGGLKVKRRAPGLHRLLMERAERTLQDPLTVLDWVNLWALAVNEENAAGRRVVTAPTNGAAGIVPPSSLLPRLHARAPRGGRVRPSCLTAAAVGSLFKEKCVDLGRRGRLPGRGRRRLLDGRRRPHAALARYASQVENAAEIGMEHNLGLTCDPGCRPRPGALHRAQRGRARSRRSKPSASPRRRRHPSRDARPGNRDDAQDRPRHERAVQGDQPRRPRRQRGGVLIGSGSPDHAPGLPPPTALALFVQEKCLGQEKTR
jgi:L-serine dehydratase